ncbi:probable integral membrane protein [Nonlabens tegetincola]|uniref:Probable integral membrane protein n=1 Tax=Nonlabens tegetincola TaxID=323273 RepID=A0A090PXI7_9FLAO|nr:efflux RND transporter permease subunit [Nonlabens tegetincola]GAK95549.1 probable integral membrane protein [Nonlabens tegetincola]
MHKLFSFSFWNSLARLILRNREVILGLIVLATIALGTQWKYMKFSHTEANLLPDDHPVNIEYDEFIKQFGEEGNLIILGATQETLNTYEKLNAWNQLADSISKFEEIDFVLSTSNLPVLELDEPSSSFKVNELLPTKLKSEADYAAFKKKLFTDLPFYKNLIYSEKDSVIRTAVYLKKDIVNTITRKEFVFNELVPLIDSYRNNGLDVRTSGMPYIRTLNAQNIVDEIGMFLLAALLITSGLFFFFFRSWRATFISIVTVIIGVMWAFGFLGLFRFEITVLTAIIPPLIIVIGIPNCIFLINKYQQEIRKHGNQALSLQRVITKVGNATLMTNLTTASGFATFIFTQSKLLKEFGIVASICIVTIFVLSLMIIPIIYSYLPLPKEKHLKHLGKTWINSFANWLGVMVKNYRIAIYITSVVVLILSFIGMYQIRVSGSLIEDMPKSMSFYKDIKFFEESFDGVMPVEIVINTKKKKGVNKPKTLKKIDKLEEHIIETPELSRPMSVISLIKFAKQAFYQGDPEFFDLPTSNERLFMAKFLKNSNGEVGLMKSYVDSTGQYARVTTFMKDMPTERLEYVEENLRAKLETLFPVEDYEITLTGKALVFQKGTNYLINNLILSLSLAILLIALFIAFMFKSLRMIFVSIVPNLLPLLMTAGLMGFIGVPIKASTILVFSIAFGISVDDTIHFLAKYRQELMANNWKIKKSVYSALKETGVSMFYTSIVLFFGFSTFTISSFGGTVALGALVSATLLFAMLSNLLLLPSMLLSLERSIANERTFKKPAIPIIAPKSDEEE